MDQFLVRASAENLLQTRNYSALIKLCSTFASVDWSFTSMIQTMAHSKDWASAELLVRTFEQEDSKGMEDYSNNAYTSLFALCADYNVNRTGQDAGGSSD